MLVVMMLSLVPNSTGQTCSQADQLLSWDDTAKDFRLHPRGLEQLKSLVRGEPVNVFAIIGEARQGKSTTLNAVYGDGQPFITSNEFEAATHGVLIKTMDQQVYLDIEGIDLGQEAVVDQLSSAAALLASDLALFVQGRPKNKDLDFLLRFCRLMDLLTMHDASMALPRLHVIVREPLAGITTQAIEQFLLGNAEDGKNSARMEVRNRFNSLEFHPVASIGQPSDYNRDIDMLRSKVRASKKSTSGTYLDGSALAEILEKEVFKRIKDTDYPFDTTFEMLDRSVCDRQFDRLVAPLLDVQEVEEFQLWAEETLDTFMSLCKVQSFQVNAKKMFDSRLQQLTLEREQRLRVEEEKKLKLLLEEERQKNEERAHKQRLEAEQAQHEREVELLRLKAEEEEAKRRAEWKRAEEVAAAQRQHEYNIARAQQQKHENEMAAQKMRQAHELQVRELELRQKKEEQAHAERMRKLDKTIHLKNGHDQYGNRWTLINGQWTKDHGGSPHHPKYLNR